MPDHNGIRPTGGILTTTGIDNEGIYVVAFSFPVVPNGEARIRVQNSAGHSREQLDQCIDTFIKVGKKFGVIK